MTLLALFGAIFIVLPSLTSSSIDHVALLLPVLVCWNWLLPVVVEGEERGRKLQVEVKLQINMDHVIMSLLLLFSNLCKLFFPDA